MIEKENKEDIKEQEYLLEKLARRDNRQMIYLIVVSVFFPPLFLLYIPWYIVYRIWFRKIKCLRDNQNVKELVYIVKNIKAKNRKFFYALYALADLEILEIKEIIIDEIMKMDKQMETSYDVYDKSHYASLSAHLIQLEHNTREIPNKKEKPSKYKSELEVVKVHFIAEEPKDAKCMVTKLALDFDKKEIVICPECFNYAIKDALKDWLKENNFCPICKTELTIDDFPFIILKK